MNHSQNTGTTRRKLLKKLLGFSIASPVLFSVDAAQAMTNAEWNAIKRIPKPSISEVPEAIVKSGSRDILEAWVGFKRRLNGIKDFNYKENHNIMNIIYESGIRNLYREAPQKNPRIYDEPAWHWTAIRFTPNEYQNKFMSGGKVSSRAIKEPAMEYLATGIWEYWHNKNNTKAEELFLTSLFLSSGFSQQDAKKVGIVTPSASPEGLALSYTNQYLKKEIPEKKQILLKIYSNVLNLPKEKIIIPNWSNFFLNLSYYEQDEKGLKTFRRFIIDEGEKRMAEKSYRLRGPPYL